MEESRQGVLGRRIEALDRHLRVGHSSLKLKHTDTGYSFRNQEEFVVAMYEGLKALCQFGKLGAAEMILMYGVRGGNNELDVKV
jgi:hypothetical protein